jgi:hypothetical protein
MSYTLNPNPDGTKTLRKEGRTLFCPYQPAQMVQMETNERGLGGQRKTVPVKMRDECGDHCPLFELLNQDAAAVLHCGSKREIVFGKVTALA